jgi:PfaD family protein
MTLTAAPVQNEVYRVLNRLDQPVHVVVDPSGTSVTTTPGTGQRVLASVGPLPPERLGSRRFRAAHGVRYAYLAGAMANGISSVELVTALARAGFLASFGSGGLPPARVDAALERLTSSAPAFAVNLLHAPHEPELERAVVESCLRHRVRCVEVSAYLELTPHLVRYRVSGLRTTADGSVVAENRVIAKVSRPEVARHFLLPPPPAMVAALLADGVVTAAQADLARRVPMADDLTVEADSAGHTDRRPLSALLPVLARLRNELRPTVRLGAAGGIGTPEAVVGAFALGADYVVTGSVNQSCVEAGTAARTRHLLATMGLSDFDMAPSAHMFELGAQVQVMRKGTMFPQRAKRLRALYETYGSLANLPASERTWLETHVLRRPIEQVWQEVVTFFADRDPAQLVRAADDPKRQMALVFRWYLGLSSKWAITGDTDRVADYQVWAGPAMGSFNDWVAGTYLADPGNRRVVDVAMHLLRGAAVLTRVRQLQLAGNRFPADCLDYRPTPLG